jgi:hypothetical protein
VSRVADESRSGRVVRADHARIDVVDRPPSARGSAAWSYRARPAADERDEVRLGDERARRQRPAVRADDADGERVVLGDRALAADRRRDRRAQRLRTSGELGLGARDTAPRRR